MLEPQLMLEVLSSPFLCSSATQMWPLLRRWASATGLDIEEFMCRLKEHVQRTGVELRNGLPANGEYSSNVLESLWERYEALVNSEGAGPFLGYWVNLQPSSPSLFQEYQQDIDMLNKLASHRKGLRLGAGQALTWMLPHATAHVVGLELFNDCEARFQISCSCDGLQWHVLLGSDPEERFQNQSLEDDYVVCYSPSPARYFKLAIMDGVFKGFFHIEGILPTC
ncbi:bath-40 [Symbiodinium sp. CCMP2592]|nr:bath-40 [Symbiodinium sp. CCMP2592]